MQEQDAIVIAEKLLTNMGMPALFSSDSIVWKGMVQQLATFIVHTYEAGFFDGERLGRCPDLQWEDDWETWRDEMRRYFNDNDVV